MSSISRDYVQVLGAEIHYAECGDGPPVVLLHQTPRSWEEFKDVLPLLGRSHRAIAMDTVGFGASSFVDAAPSIEHFGRYAAGFIEALEVGPVHLVGHHTGGVIAVEVAAVRPDLVDKLVLSSTPYCDGAFRAERAGRAPVDDVHATEDGSHLIALWNQRRSFYPAGRIDLLSSFVLDAMKVGEGIHWGHVAVGSYRMEDRIEALRERSVLLIGATEDPFAYHHLPAMQAALPQAGRVDIAGGMVPLPDQLPEQFAEAVADFLKGA